MVKVEYEVLEPVRNITEAMAEDAPKIHPSGNLCQSRHVRRGDAKTALEKSKYTVTETFDTPFTEHAFLEPECAIAFPYKDGVKIYSTDQSVFDTRKEVSLMFGWDPEKGNLSDILPGMSIGGNVFGNYEGALPRAGGRRYFECDIDYDGGYRGPKRLIYSNDGLVFYTEDHYKTFEQLY